MQGQKGITLVALIITIIVMLILVAVTVSLVAQTDLITLVKSAGMNGVLPRINIMTLLIKILVVEKQCKIY